MGNKSILETVGEEKKETNKFETEISRVKQELWVLKISICTSREELAKERWEREVITQLLSEHIYSWAILQKLEEPKPHDTKREEQQELQSDTN